MILAKGGGQLALDNIGSGGIRYLGGEVYCLIRGGRESSSFETGSTELHGTFYEDYVFPVGQDQAHLCET